MSKLFIVLQEWINLLIFVTGYVTINIINMYYSKIGKMALGSRLRLLSDLVTEDAQKLYEIYGFELKPKWFPVFYYLSQNKESKSITRIANEIGHSHPSVIKIVREMVKGGLVIEKRDRLDRRKNNIELTNKGIELSSNIKVQYTDVTNAIEKTFSQAQHNIWLAMEELEYLLDQKSIFTRVIEEKKLRESKKVKIVKYKPKYKEVFKSLNEDWITRYFKIEEVEEEALNNPKKYILDNGGEIFIAIYEGEPIGVCALLKMENSRYDYELAKMAVSKKAQEKGIGFLLGKAIIDEAKLLGARSIYLESNTILKPAISLYRKLGFKKVVDYPTPYERCNIQMELIVQKEQ